MLGVITAVPVRAAAPLGERTGPQTQVGNKGWCASFNMPVAANAGGSRTWKVAVTYCQPFKWAKGKPQVDVLTHGATYNRAYWDWPQNAALYSYTEKTLAAGRATLNYDRIGNGKSTRPHSTAITMTSDAHVLHQLIQGLQMLGYKQINSIGHSYGSGVVIAEAATYKDVSKVVLTGYLHVPSNPAVVAGSYPANQDPKFIHAGLDEGYLTSRPGVRGTSYHSPSSDPNVVGYDEVQKDLVSRTGLLDFLAQRSAPTAQNLSNKIQVPVLLISGQQDNVFCYDPAILNCSNTAAVTAHEAPFYASASKLNITMVPNSGHNLTLHPTANDSFAAINQWIKSN